MVSLFTALENETCETCGCTPCDCNQSDGQPQNRSYNNGEIFEILTPEEHRLESLAAIILRRKQTMPMELHDASVDEVRKYLRGKYQRV